MASSVETGLPGPLTILSEDEVLFRDAVREFARDEIAPRVAAMDEAQEMDPSLIRQFFELGLMGVEVPDRYGGTGASFFTAVLVVEELSRVDPSVGVLVDVQNTLVNNAFLRWGSDGLKERYLPALTSEKVGAYALSEAGSGSDAFALACRATRVDGGFRLEGRKLWITNGGEAEVFIEGIVSLGSFDGAAGLFAQTDDEPHYADQATWTDASRHVVAGTDFGSYEPPRYFIKQHTIVPGSEGAMNMSGYGDNKGSGDVTIFRITARGTGASADSAEVILRSQYGRKTTRGAFIVELVLGGCAAYRTQLFLYLKACGREELTTMNLWGGMDAPAASV